MFTKEELKILFIELHNSISSWGDQAPKYKNYPALKTKILNIIQHIEKQELCEHDWQWEFNDYYCLKCDARR